MKYSVLFLTYIMACAVYALCPVDDNSVCTLPETGRNVKPLFQNPSAGMVTTGVGLKPMTTVNPLGQTDTLNRDLNYDTNCQFGNCLDKPNNKLTPKQN